MGQFASIYEHFRTTYCDYMINDNIDSYQCPIVQHYFWQSSHPSHVSSLRIKVAGKLVETLMIDETTKHDQSTRIALLRAVVGAMFSSKDKRCCHVYIIFDLHIGSPP